MVILALHAKSARAIEAAALTTLFKTSLGASQVTWRLKRNRRE